MMTWGKYSTELEGVADAVDNPPLIDCSSRQVLDLFWHLSGARSYGFGPNPIAVADMAAMFAMLDLEQDTRLEYAVILQRMDRAWLEQAQVEQDSKTKS